MTYQPCPDPTPRLSGPERSDLERLETVISRGLGTFHEVGRALIEVRDRKLYREEFATFDGYAKKRWGFSRSHAYRLMVAGEVMDDLSPIGDDVPPPESESQTRPLAALPTPEARREVWAEASAEGQPTAAEVERLTRKALAGLAPDRQAQVVQQEEEAVLRRASERHQRDAADAEKQATLAAARHLRNAIRHARKVGPGADRAIELWEEGLRALEADTGVDVTGAAA